MSLNQSDLVGRFHGDFGFVAEFGEGAARKNVRGIISMAEK